LDTERAAIGEVFADAWMQREHADDAVVAIKPLQQ
jgi:hypothetical protein